MYYEEQYPEMARACRHRSRDEADGGVRPHRQDLPRRVFSAFCIILMRKEGVDFWWIDWQQGTKSKMKGTSIRCGCSTTTICRTSAATEKRGMILSRYAGPGSHRYPLGFSGDTIVCLEQPETSAVVHRQCREHRIYVVVARHRRAHVRKGDPNFTSDGCNSGCSRRQPVCIPPKTAFPKNRGCTEKRRRRSRRTICVCATGCCRTFTPRTSAPRRTESTICAPLYYYWDSPFAYAMKNEYVFGSELIVAPVTGKAKRDGLAASYGVAGRKARDGFLHRETYEGERLVTVKSRRITSPCSQKRVRSFPCSRKGRATRRRSTRWKSGCIRADGEYVMHDEKGSISFRTETNGKRDAFFRKAEFRLRNQDDKSAFL